MSYFGVRGSKPMKVFISWSGTKSQDVAKILKQWIPCVIQSVEPYFSSADIDKGARWSTDIAKELQDASFGILCVTKDNLSSSWLNFEAGALSKSIEQSKVCPFLVDLKPSDIQNSPILQFQMASATKDDVLKLFMSINSILGESKLHEDVLNTTFDIFWPKIEDALNAVASVTEAPVPTKKSSKDTQAPIEEILELVRYQHKLLKTPEELLPAQYLLEVLRKNNRTLPKSIIYELENQLHSIYVLASEILEDCKIKSTPEIEELLQEYPTCISRIQEIQNRTHRLSLQLRKYQINSDLTF